MTIAEKFAAAFNRRDFEGALNVFEELGYSMRKGAYENAFDSMALALDMNEKALLAKKSPEETVKVEEVQRFLAHLRELLAKLKEQALS